MMRTMESSGRVRVVSLEQPRIQAKFALAMGLGDDFVRVTSAEHLLHAVAVECDLLILSTHGDLDADTLGHSGVEVDIGAVAASCNARALWVNACFQCSHRRALWVQSSATAIVGTAFNVPDTTSITAAKRLAARPELWGSGQGILTAILDSNQIGTTFRNAGWWAHTNPSERAVMG